MAINIQTGSYLSLGTLYTDNGFEYWDLIDIPEIPLSGGDQYIQVQTTDRVDTLASRHYGDAEYAWAIARANDLEIKETELQPGAIIRIPDLNVVRNLSGNNS